MGMSRSATIVIMYLMRKFQLGWDTAFKITKLRRDIIDPNEGFIKKLKEYEGKQYKLKRTITVCSEDKINESDEFSEFSDSDESSTSSEDLMDKRRNSFEL